MFFRNAGMVGEDFFIFSLMKFPAVFWNIEHHESVVDAAQ